MQEFVCVRVVQANAMDLALFQFDYDMSIAVTFLNPDRTIYARYGSRRGNAELADAEMSMEGLQASLRGVLALHGEYPGNKGSLAGKQPRGPVPYPVPEDHPLLKKYTSKLDYGGKVAGSCIHCHQIRDVKRQAKRETGEILSPKLLTPYPMPSVLGFEVDPKTAATVASVSSGSPAAAAGFVAGDVILAMRGQPIVSLADIQWVLHHVTGPTTVTARVRRGDTEKDLVLRLSEDWDKQSDISWRVSTWDLRRMALGGMLLSRMSPEERQADGLPEDKMALRAEHVGQYNDHAVAKRAGLRKGDVIVKFDGIDDDLSESALLRQVLGKRKRGESVRFLYRRDGEEKEAVIRLQ